MNKVHPFIPMLGRAISERRKILGLDQESVLDYAEIGLSTLSNIEQGKRNPTLGTVMKILDYLGLELVVRVKEK